MLYKKISHPQVQNIPTLQKASIVSLITTNYKEKMTELFGCFRDAENEVKKFEKEYGDVPIPSINELRYAGYHIAEAAQNDSSEVSINDNIDLALNHCKRAKYDAHEASTMLVLEKIKDFNDRYRRLTETTETISSYVETLQEIDEISEKLQETIPSSYGSREEYYGAVSEGDKKLKTILKKFQLSEISIESRVKENNDKKKQSTRRFITTTLLTVLGIVVLITARVLVG